MRTHLDPPLLADLAAVTRFFVGALLTDVKGVSSGVRSGIVVVVADERYPGYPAHGAGGLFEQLVPDYVFGRLADRALGSRRLVWYRQRHVANKA